MSPEAVLDFWFGAPGSDAAVIERQRSLWFGKSAEADAAVKAGFSDALVDARAGRLDAWAATPRGLLALIVVLDQFPHHIHRNQAAAFACDAQALDWALTALKTDADRALKPVERVFVYLPLEHAESRALQACSVALYADLARESAPEARALFDSFLDYAVQHRDVVARFGRFPHRNAVLGRASTDAEVEFLKQPGSRF